MHGRLKVKTTAEQQEAKRIEREKKVKAYLGATTRIFEKRGKQEHDKEMLELTAQLLSANPDFYTLWNIRREVFLTMKDLKSEDDMQELHNHELYFVEQCLKINPKSYGSWQHRCWLMDAMPRPDWKTELALCTKYLEYDERNFHCWDYRRFVVQRSKVTAKEEFDFSTSKISSNFSNYSSWHYRSKLLPLIHPDPQHPVGVQEEALLQEFELAQNAFFTDPNDQSAWFYHRWLLGKAEKPLAAESVIVSRSRAKLFLYLTKAAKCCTDFSIQATVNETPLPDGEWVSLPDSQYSLIWMRDLDASTLSTEKELKFTITVSPEKSEEAEGCCCCCLKPGDSDCSWRQHSKIGSKFSYELSAATTSTLTSELESCQQLDELEPDNKWTMLTIISLMRALDPIKHVKETLEYLGKLERVDPMRTNYYRDLRSKFIMENAIETQPSDSRAFNQTGQDLTAVYHLEHLATMTTIDLSHNSLSSVQNAHHLQLVQKLILDDNKIESCTGLVSMMSLEELSLRNNCIRHPEDLAPLSACKLLRTVQLEGNPVCKLETLQSDLQSVLPGVTVTS